MAKISRRAIIFGCGYIGQALADCLMAKGIEVFALTRNESKAKGLEESGIRTIVAEIDSEDWHGELSGEFDFIVNCVSSAGGGIEGYRKSYVKGQLSVLAWAQKVGFQGTYVYTSSTSVYPQVNGEEVNEESSNEGTSEFGKVLLEAESILLESTQAWKKAYVVRLAGIYGPERHYLLNQLRDGVREFDGRGDFYLNLIHRDDAVSAIESCLLQNDLVASGIFNVSDGNPATKEEIVQHVAECIDAGSIRFYPDRVPQRQRALRSANQKMPNRRIDNTKLKEAFAWKPTYDDYKKGYSHLLNLSAL